MTLDARKIEALTEEIYRLRLEVAELRASRQRLAVAAETDRRVIERDVHEIVSQQLVALAVNVQRAGAWIEARPDAARELLEGVKRDLQKALDETAQLAQRIYPAMLNTSGLASALRSVASSAGIRVSVDIRAGANYPRDVAARIYFGCLDALEAIGGRSLTVTLREEEGSLNFEVVEVVEDGARPTATRASSDAALSRLRDRLEALGGRLTIRSEPRQGLRVLGSVPLSQ